MIYEELISESSTKVLIIDDKESEVRSIRNALEHKEIPYEYRPVDFSLPADFKPIDSVELVFLDLDYQHGMLNTVNPDLCAEQVRQGVNPGQVYYLVGWTKDPDEMPDVVHALIQLELSPVTYVALEKNDYRIGDEDYNIDKLFNDINIKFKETETVREFLGQIIAREEDGVLINCIVLEEPGTFEVRRFDLEPFREDTKLDKGSIVKIKVITKPGSRIYEFLPENDDKAALFIKSDDFEDFDDLSFLNE